MILTLLMALIILRPHPDGVGAQVALFGSDVLLLGGLVILVIGRGTVQVPRSMRPILVLGLLLLTVGWILAGVNLQRGVMLPDISRFTLFLALFVLLLDHVGRQPLNERQIGAKLDRFFWIVVAVAVVQLIDPPFLGPLVRDIWGSTKLRGLGSGYPRVYSTFYNANWFAVYLVFMLAHWLGRALTATRIGPADVAKSIALVAMLFVSGSRTGLIGSAIVLAAGVPLVVACVWKVRIGRSLFLLVPLVVLALFFSLEHIEIFGRLVDRYAAFQMLLSEGHAESSLEGRLLLWRVSVDTFFARPLLGYGAVPEGLLPHNSYLAIAIAMGLPGLMIFVLLIAGILVHSTAVVVLTRSPASVGFLLFTAALAVIGLSGEYFFSGQLVALWSFSHAVAFAGRWHAVPGQGVGPDGVPAGGCHAT